MAQERLDMADVRPALEQVDGDGVPQQMRMQVLDIRTPPGIELPEQGITQGDGAVDVPGLEDSDLTIGLFQDELQGVEPGSGMRAARRETTTLIPAAVKIAA